jgi:TetR/AcrR family transcriptional repressor of nem operon
MKAVRDCKGQFYHYFKNKDGLVHEVLQTYLEAIRNRGGPLSYDITSWDDLDRWFIAPGRIAKALSDDTRVPIWHDWKRGDGER